MAFKHICSFYALFIIFSITFSRQFKWSSSFKYVWVGPELTSWDAAEAFCKLVFQTSLASIHSPAENTEAWNLCVSGADNGCFIGFNDKTIEGDYSWIDSTPVDFINWDVAETQPNGAVIANEDGTVIQPEDGLWHDTPFDTNSYPFLCNAPSNDFYVWSANNNYILVGPTRTDNWENANQFCADKFDTTLATIHSPAQNTEITDLCNLWSGYHCFIGLNDINVEDTWEWVDKSPIDYGLNWNPGEPDNAPHGQIGEDCGLLSYPNTNWGDGPCYGGIDYYTFICNAPSSIDVWSDNGNYIWVGPTKMSWYGADNYCINNFGTHLASVHSQSQYDEVQELCIKWNTKYEVPPAGSNGIFQSCYIGLNDITTESIWEWIDTSAVDFGPIWQPGEPNNNGPEDCAVACYGCKDGWADVSCQDLTNFHSTFVCNAPPSCEVANDIKHIDWDLISNDVNNDQIPYYNMTTSINNDLSLEFDIDLEYLGSSTADNGISGFGTTYFLSFNSFSADTLDIFSDNGLSECDNRVSSSFIGKSWSEKWSYSETPYISGHVASDTYLAYPPPGLYWDLTSFGVDTGNKCSRINYAGWFTWEALQSNCTNPLTTESSVNIVINDKWINLTGTIYVNVISPLYKESDTGLYRIHEITNQDFTIAVSKSVHVLSSTGISLFKITIIQQNTEGNLYKLALLTESADYLELTSPQLLVSPNGYTFNIESINDNENCLNYKTNICIQLWQITTQHSQTCNNFGGNYGIQWTAQCNNNTANNTRCVQYDGDSVTMSVESDYEDATCGVVAEQIQFDGQMSFYTNDSFVGNQNNEYLFIVGIDTIYVQVEINNPPESYSIFSSKLINVWLCTIDDESYGNTFTVSQADPATTGCFSSIIDSDGYNPYWIIQNFDQTLEHEAAHISASNTNIVRFSFKTPYTLTRDTLWIHAQIELSLVDNNRRIRRLLFDTSGDMEHFMSSVDVQYKVIDGIDTTATVHGSTTKVETDAADKCYGIPLIVFSLSMYYLF